MRRNGASQAASALLIIFALLPCLTRAEGLSASIEPDYSYASTRSTDQAGHVTTSTTEEFAQHYRLMFDRRLLPLVQVDALGLFDQINDWLTTNNVSSRSDEWRAGGVAHLRFGPPVLNGELGYERHDDSTSSALGGPRLHTISEIYSARAGWHPADWPSLDLRLSQANNYDAARQLSDATTNDVLLSTEYSAYRQLRLGYTLDYNVSTDHLTGTETKALNNTARANYTETFNGGRTAVLATYQFSNRVADTTVRSGAGGTVAMPQLPSAGLSLVAVFPAVPETDTLGLNPALIDGNLTSPASVNIGFSVSLNGDNNPRELGLQFTDPNTPVNTLYVWVDRQLPIEISSAYSWTAYRSDDNVNWTKVNVVAPVVFSAFQSRFEITIDETRARYVKVITRPLSPVITADRRFQDVFVTELQAFDVVSAQSVRGTISSTNHTATAALRQQLLADPMLQYDFNGTLTTGSGGTSYTVQNGLSLDRRLSRILVLAARVARLDVGQYPPGQQPAQHTGSFQYSTSLTATPLPTLNHGLTYTGQYVQTTRGTSELNAFTFVNRAQLYRGVDALVSLGYAYNLLDTGATSQGPTALATLSLVPNSVVTLSSSYYYSRTQQTGGNLPEITSENERVDSSVTITPFPALYLNGSVSRIIKGARPTTLATVGGNFSPFPDGTVLLRAAYTESFDTAEDNKNSVGSAGVRWNIRPGLYIDLNYSLIDSSSNVSSSHTQALQAMLVLLL
jgi:hypothetical protein